MASRSTATASNYVSRTAQQVEKLSTSGRLTSPAFRGKKINIGDQVHTKATPEFRGTLQAHKWLHVTVHHTKTKESFPLVVLYRTRDRVADMNPAMAVLARLTVRFMAILFDKEFTGSYALLDAVRQYADPRGVYVTGPMVKQGQIGKMVQEAWDNEDAAFIPEAVETLYHYSRLHKSPSDPRGAHYIILTYHRDEIRSDLSVALPSSFVYHDPATGIGIRGIAWYCNREVPIEYASWFASLYARRWACESLFMRHVTLMGRSQSQYADIRHFAYAASFHILALYGAWRALQRHATRAT